MYWGGAWGGLLVCIVLCVYIRIYWKCQGIHWLMVSGVVYYIGGV